MRRDSGLFSTLVDPEHLRQAAVLSAGGKRRRKDVAWFLFRMESELARLRAELSAGSWRPEGFELVRLRDPKPRLIARAPFADRVVHTALVKAMEPTLMRTLMPECMACRPGLGTHRAVLALQQAQRRHRFCVHLDVRAYFPSVDLVILRRLLAARIDDPQFLAVLGHVLDAGSRVYARSEARRWLRLVGPHRAARGLPVGTYTSQVLASWLYLDAFDHHIKRRLKVPDYLRYVDDIFLFGDRRAQLRDWRDQVAAWLHEHRRLTLKHPQARILSCRGHLDALGHRIRRRSIDALPRATRQLQARVGQAWTGRTWTGRGKNDLEASVAASVGLILAGSAGVAPGGGEHG